ncbi:MAG: Engulfment and cell motility protein 3 [Paramarteilia canceri]
MVFVKINQIAVWKIIEGVYSNSELIFDREESELLLSLIVTSRKNVYLLKTITTYINSLEDFNLSSLGNITHLLLIEFSEESEAIATIKLAYVLAQKCFKTQPDDVILFFNGPLFSKFYTFYEVFGSNLKQSVKDDDRKILNDEIKQNLTQIQNLMVEIYFESMRKKSVDFKDEQYQRIAMDITKILKENIAEKEMDHSCLINFDDPDNQSLFKANQGGEFLLFALHYLTFKSREENFGTLYYDICTFNQACNDSKKKFNVIKMGVIAMEMIQHTISILRGKPLKELFCMFLKNLFMNWRDMSGSIELVQNIKNFSFYQIKVILSLQEVRMSKSFHQVSQYSPNYRIARHNWLTIDIKSIVKEPFKIHKTTSDELQQELELKVVNIIALSRLKLLTDNQLRGEKVTKYKDRKLFIFGLTKDYSFFYNEIHDNIQEKEKMTILQMSDFEGIFRHNIVPKNLIDRVDPSIKKKAKSDTVFLFFKGIEPIVFYLHPEEREYLDEVIDCLYHLVRKPMPTEAFSEDYLYLMYILKKARLLELHGVKIPETIPKIPPIPNDLDELSNLLIFD